MTADRKKPGVAFWATVVLVAALVAYPLSFGPFCWLVYHDHLPNGRATRSALYFYSPIIFAARSSEFIAGAMSGYVRLWTGVGVGWNDWAM
jgi:hypothetical protein